MHGCLEEVKKCPGRNDFKPSHRDYSRQWQKKKSLLGKVTLLQQLLIYSAPTMYQVWAKLYHVILILIGSLLKKIMIKVKVIKNIIIL